MPIDITPGGHAAALWAGLNLLVLLVLSVLVVRQRRAHKVAAGDGGVPELLQALRAFGNASEYIPAAIAGLVALAVAGAPPALIHIVGAVLLIGRVAHAVGISASAGPSIGRTVGMVCTWLAYVFLAVALLVFSIG
jgi:uncharacterized membrane protein YecN with MAPEG domain